MRPYSLQSDRLEINPNGRSKKNIIETLEGIIVAKTGVSHSIREVGLFYVRQTVGNLPDGRGVVYYFEPEFIYAADIGMPRMALIALPYQVPTVPGEALGSYITVGRGDGEFPQFEEASVWSAAGLDNRDILYAASPGSVIIGAKEGVDEAALRKALAGRVDNLTNEGFFYTGRITPFDETRICSDLQNSVAEVRYASPNGQVRSSAGPWWVDRVL